MYERILYNEKKITFQHVPPLRGQGKNIFPFVLLCESSAAILFERCVLEGKGGWGGERREMRVEKEWKGREKEGFFSR